MYKKDYSDIIDKCVEMYQDGKSIRFIANSFGIHKNTISRLIKTKIELRERRITEEERQLFYELYCKGYTVAEIMSETKRGYQSVARVLKDYGIGNYGENRKFEHLKEELVKDYNNGMSLSEIGTKYNISRGTVHEYLKDEDITLRENFVATREYFVNDDYFDELDSHKFYILGRIFATGNIYCVNESYFLNICVDTKDIQNTINTIKDFTNKDTNNLQVNKSDGSTRIRINSKKIYSKLQEFKLGEYVPETLNNKEFWRGFLDMSIKINDNKLSIGAGIYKKDVINMLKNNGVDEKFIRNYNSNSIVVANNIALRSFLKYYNFSEGVKKYLINNKSTKWSNFLNKYTI